MSEEASVAIGLLCGKSVAMVLFQISKREIDHILETTELLKVPRNGGSVVYKGRLEQVQILTYDVLRLHHSGSCRNVRPGSGTGTNVSSS